MDRNDFDIKEVNPTLTILDRLTAPNVYADGIAQIMIGFPISKIVFHTIYEPKTDSSGEIRKCVQTLSIPTVSALEMARHILGAAKQSEAKLSELFSDETLNKIKGLLVDIPDSVSGLVELNNTK